MILSTGSAWACPFCAPTSSDIFTIVDNSLAVARVEKLGTGKFKILEVLRGEAKVGRVVLAGEGRVALTGKPDTLILSTISNPKQPYWSEPVRPLTKREFSFMKKGLADTSDQARWDLAASHLEDSSKALAESAYNLLAPAPIEEVQKRAKLCGLANLKKWVQDPRVLSERKSLYILMALPQLTKADQGWLRKLLLDPPLSTFASHLPPMMVAYAEVTGPKAIAEMEKVFLPRTASASATFGATSGFAYIGGKSRNAKVRKAARQVFRRELAHPDRGVFAIAPLAEWRDYSVADEIEALADTHAETPWVVSSAARYFRSFERPEAKSALQRLKKKYPKIVESARKPFPKVGD